MISRMLQHFLAAYDRRNVTVAAGDVRISQSALTRSLRSLEEKLGVPLFERLPHGIVPTSYGKVLAHYAQRIQQESRRAADEIEAMRSGSGGHIRIGADPLWLAHVLPQVVSEFTSLWGDVRLSITQETARGALSKILAGEIDLYCGALDVASQPDLEIVQLATGGYRVLASSSHDLAAAGSLRPQDLLGYPWALLMDDGSGRAKLNAYFASFQLSSPVILLETSSASCMLQAIAGGRMLGCLAPTLLKGLQRSDLTLLPLDQSIGAYRAGTLRSNAVPGFAAVDRFSEALKGAVAACEIGRTVPVAFARPAGSVAHHGIQ